MLLFIALIFAVTIIASELVTLFTPVIVYGVTYLVKKFLPNISGWIIVMLVVPLLSLAVAWLTTLLASSELTFWEQFGYGLLAVFINELFAQLKSSSSSEDTVK